jgi:predicted SAM-dependent methyltransferase
MSRKLHIGGTIRTEGWEVFNAVAGTHVDHLGNAKDLSRFADQSFDVLYASHVLEHFDYINELGATLKEWLRVLKPEGTLYASVPDMDILAQLFLLKDKLNQDERFFVMRMMFGGHIDAHDYHQVGLNQDFLTDYLTQAGFTNIKRVDSFDLFHDTSETQFRGVPISVNLIASKP